MIREWVKKLMRFARFDRACGALLVLGVAGLGGCGSGSAPPPASKEDSKIREDMKSAHQSLKRKEVGRQGSDAVKRKSMRAAHGGH
jgi:hypothetical protein